MRRLLPPVVRGDVFPSLQSADLAVAHVNIVTYPLLSGGFRYCYYYLSIYHVEHGDGKLSGS